MRASASRRNTTNRRRSSLIQPSLAHIRSCLFIISMSRTERTLRLRMRANSDTSEFTAIIRPKNSPVGRNSSTGLDCCLALSPVLACRRVSAKGRTSGELELCRRSVRVAGPAGRVRCPPSWREGGASGEIVLARCLETREEKGGLAPREEPSTDSSCGFLFRSFCCRYLAISVSRLTLLAGCKLILQL
jgi:hypothetical protein